MSKTEGIYAHFTTDKGKIVVELFYEKCPMTVCNFVGLAEGKMENSAKPIGVPFYENTKFHRVISKINGDGQDFMIQGGDPKGNGTGGPGYQFPDEFDKTLRHNQSGVLAMANAGAGTNGSQFYITHVPTPWLDDKHTVFGQVIEGQEVVNKMRTADTLLSLTIERIGKKALQFKTSKEELNRYISEIDLRKKEAEKSESSEFLNWVKSNHPETIFTPSGLGYLIEKEGTGKKAEKGKTVSVHYVGTFQDGSIFDSSVARKQPIEFPLGMGMVIDGWEEGIELLKEGSKAKLFIPYQLAYGKEGRSSIPPKANLIFDTELITVSES